VIILGMFPGGKFRSADFRVPPTVLYTWCYYCLHLQCSFCAQSNDWCIIIFTLNM